MAQLTPVATSASRSTRAIITETLAELREQEKRLATALKDLVEVREKTQAELTDTRTAIRGLEGTEAGRPEPKAAPQGTPRNYAP